MGNVYIGVSNKARKVSNIYVGVSNKARKVQKAYVGVSNKARLVYQSGPDPTKTEYTEAEVNELIVYGIINQVAVGSTFTIANSYDTSRSGHTYVVIGKDHKDLNTTNYPVAAAATGTVDVWGTGAITGQIFSSVSPFGRWSTSPIRTWLNGDFYNGFNSTTKAHLKKMTVESYWVDNNGNSTTMITKGNNNTTDYVKLLSIKEFNPSTYEYSGSTYYMHQREGNGYEYFPSVPYNSGNNTDAQKRHASIENTWNYQWTRSKYFKYNSGNIYMVEPSGRLKTSIYSSQAGIVPCFRLGT